MGANASEEHHGETEAECGGCGVDYGVEEVEVFLCHDNGYAEYGAVCGNQGEVDAEGCVESGGGFLDNNLEHLDQYGDDEDEGYGLDELKAKGDEDVVLEQPCDGGGHGHYEGDGHAHSEGRVDVFGDSDEWTYAEELGEDYIVDQYGGEYYGEICEHGLFLLSIKAIEDCDEQAEDYEGSGCKDEQQGSKVGTVELRTEYGTCAEEFAH